MSADDGVYVGSFPTESGEIQYRVAYCQAIDNTEDNERFPNDLTDAYIVQNYCDSAVWKDRHEAFAFASKLYEKVGDCEYGIQLIEYPRPFSTMTYETAELVMNQYWGSRGK